MSLKSAKLLAFILTEALAGYERATGVEIPLDEEKKKTLREAVTTANPSPA